MVFVKIYDAWQVLKRVIPYLIMIPFIIDDVVTYFVILTGKQKNKKNLLQHISNWLQNINLSHTTGSHTKPNHVPNTEEL